MPLRTQNLITKDFEKILNNLSYSKNRGKIFSDWLEIAAITLRQMPFNAGELPKDETYQQYEQQYLESIRPYDRQELTEFSKLLALTIEGIQSHSCDFLGEICSSLELTNERAGQFFTPYTISTAMAATMMGDVKQQVQDKGIITISDPASGAGGILIAAAHEVAKQKIDPRSHIQFHATDISRNCFNMTYIQLSLMDLQAVIQHGNTLSMEMWETRKTPQMMLFEDWLEKAQANEKTIQMIGKMREFLSQLEQTQIQIEEPTQSLSQQESAFKTTSETKEKIDLTTIQADVVFDPQQLSLFDSNQYQ